MMLCLALPNNTLLMTMPNVWLSVPLRFVL
ncbi:unnamed protein product [Linum tenue]|uniref:Uncharacterized protein n=1 Tax=Linum tenue TaxID=586396 RepID=A0AAV0KBU2_9ROSI|nr:unnamed protein product [Linum tenue]